MVHFNLLYIKWQTQFWQSFPQVDGQPLQGFSNIQAVDVLRNTGQEVNLKVARYQHGAKFEKLQQYLGKYKRVVCAVNERSV